MFCVLLQFFCCLQVYNTKDVAFLLDPKDSVQAYEEAGKVNKKESQYEKGMRALASLEHVQQLTAIEGKIIKLKLLSYTYYFENFNPVYDEYIHWHIYISH